MAVKITRQANKIALIGAPTSAAAHAPGQERAPAALRAAGLVEKLQAAGYEVTDLGDFEPKLYQLDEESPRVRNLGPTLAALEALRPQVEQATKSGALPVVLGGDCTIALATLAGVRRYYRGVSLIYFDRDADLNVPATTPSGCLDGMVVAHLTGRGAPELVRFWGEPPLVREPDIALFGLARLDPPEEQWLARSPMLRYPADTVKQQGPAAAAQSALERIHAAGRQFVLHFDVDVIASEDFAAADMPGAGGLRLEEVRQALEVFVRQENLLALEITEFNPEHDPDGSAARLLVELLASALAARLAALTASAPTAVEVASETASPAERPAEKEIPAAGEVAPSIPETSPAPSSAEPPPAPAESAVDAGETATPAAESASSAPDTAAPAEQSVPETLSPAPEDATETKEEEPA